MAMEGWQARTEEVAEFIAVDGFDAQLRQVVQFQINFGNENTDQQERVWDSIKSMIYQNGKPVQEARLSDGEFVFTANAVKGAGNGNKARGAAKMYEMMNAFERMA